MDMDIHGRLFGTLMIKGSSDQSHFIFEINVGKSRIRHRTTLKLNDVIFNRFWVDLEIHHSISESFYIGSDSFRHWFQKYNGFDLNYPKLEIPYIWLLLASGLVFSKFHYAGMSFSTIFSLFKARKFSQVASDKIAILVDVCFHMIFYQLPNLASLNKFCHCFNFIGQRAISFHKVRMFPDKIENLLDHWRGFQRTT